MIESDDENSECCVQKHRKYYRSMDRTLDEAKGKWPSIVIVNVISQHADGLITYLLGLCRDVLANGIVGVR